METAIQEIRLKTRSAYIARVSVKLVADAVILLAILTFFTDEYAFLSECVPFILLSILITIPLLWGGMESSKKFNIFFAGAGGTLFLIGQFFLGLPWWLSVLLLFLLHWRVSTHLEEERNSRFEISVGFMLGLMTVSLLSYAYQNIYHKQPAEIILILFVTGMLVYSGGTYIVRYAESAEHSKRSTRATSAKLPLIFLAVLAGFSAVLVFLNEAVSNLLNSAFQGFFWVISFLIDPIWNLINWLLGFISPKGAEELESMKNSLEKMPYEVTQEQAEKGGELSFAWWDEALIGVLISIILLYIWRRYKNKGWTETEDSTTHAGYSSYKEAEPANRESRTLNVGYSSANSEIRRSIFSLEKLAEEKGMFRLNGETLQEWFSRLGFQEEPEFYRLYEEVRYGNKEVHADKVAWFKQCVVRVTVKINQAEGENRA
ncbi:hypothetical protein [Bacillus sp. SG-1]|uniref:hypothetical protein n=1 Tax=Bacillus sp. SG-1 TaxID=161544 RepID=UPI0001543571|nr:hypothetical protein [Bacillus sp. SG-1]EDL65079.1 hypothetical protein BSG1_07114 [Bacillus sp. SG-1]